jgi:CRISPR system Cascade subunit CasD
MVEALCFTLAAPMGSFGAVAGNLSRGTLDRPGHSLIVGLIGAALGLERDDPRLLAMSEELRVVVSMEASGQHLRDYHTVQTAKERRGFRPSTRRELLEDGDLNTIITERDYLTDLCITVAVLRDDGPFTLAEMARALRQPHFTLYLGRKSCPLALPVLPDVIEADTAELALTRYAQCNAGLTDALFPVRRKPVRLVGDGRLFADGKGQRVRRRTLPDDRATWRYRLLDELVLSATGEPSA